MEVIVPQFISVTTSRVILAGWKNICIIPTGTVTITNSLSPNEVMTITTALSIGLNQPNTDTWGDITVTGVASVIMNGSAQA